MGPVGISLIALAGVFLGSQLSGEYSLTEQRRQAVEERARQKAQFTEERSRLLLEKKEQVYLRYASAVREYRIALHERYKTGRVPLDLKSKRMAYDSAYNTMNIYASDVAWEMAQDTVVNLAIADPELAKMNNFFPVRREMFKKWEDIEIDIQNTEQDFAVVMCKELPTAPRKGCLDEEVGD